MSVGLASIGSDKHYLQSKVQSGGGFDPAALKNLMQNAGSYQCSAVNGPTFLNSDNYPSGTLPATWFGSTFVPPLFVAQTLVFAWKGTMTSPSGTTGAFRLDYGAPGFTVVSDPGGVVRGGTYFNLSVEGTDGYVEFVCAGTPGFTSLIFLDGCTFTNLSNFIFCRKSDYQSIVNATGPEQLWTDEYISLLRSLNLRTIRSLNFIDVNGPPGNFTQHRYRQNWNNGIFFGSRWLPTCWAGSASGTNAYTLAAATDTPAAYTMGEVVQGLFVNASTTTPLTVNVGGRGIVPLFDMTGAALGTIAANSNASLIYDALLGGYLFSSNGNFPAYGCPVELPIELFVGLCNRVHVNAWVTLPFHVTTGDSTMEGKNTVYQMVSYMAKALNYGLNLEFGNEIWNFGYPFNLQTTFAANCGVKFGFPSDNGRQWQGFHAYQIVQMAKQAQVAWISKQKLQCVIAFQAFGPPTSTRPYKLKGADLASVANGGQGNATWVSYTGNANLAVFPNRPIDVCDVMAYATYWSGHECQNFDGNYTNLTTLTAWADLWNSGVGANITQAYLNIDADLEGSGNDQTLSSLNTNIYPQWETATAEFDGARPVGKVNVVIELYEGACEINAPSTSRCTALGVSTAYSATIASMFDGYKKSRYFYARVKRQFDQFLAASPGRANVPAWFVATPYSQWSMLSGSDVTSAPYQSYYQVRDYYG
jgi:hypothetical protein